MKLLAASCLTLILVAAVAAQSGKPPVPTSAPQAARPAPQAEPSGPAARGDYLTHDVAMCVQCHSPRDQRGNILEGEEFTGAPIPVNAPGFMNGDWALRAPNISGLPGFTDDDVVQLLTIGHMPGRPAPMRPMPPFRMSKEDAQAIVAYLRAR